MVGEIRDGFQFDAIHFPYYRKDAISVIADMHTVEEYANYINEHGIEQAEIVMPNLDILKSCPLLKHLRVHPSYNAPPDFDFSPLYEMSEIKSIHCVSTWGNREQYVGKIDYSKLNGLVCLSFEANRGALNYNKIETLKSLNAGSFKGENRDLTDLFCSKELDTLRLIQCGVYSLDGIETSEKMQCLYLDYNRSLRDISALEKVKKTLRLLRIDCCPKIEDFSVLGELENLELLELTGSNTLPDLNFIKRMKNLKTFVFNFNVLDGDLSPCLDLSYVYSDRNRKHYNIKDKDLPKNEYVRGNEDIEEWRRLE